MVQRSQSRPRHDNRLQPASLRQVQHSVEKGSGSPFSLTLRKRAPGPLFPDEGHHHTAGAFHDDAVAGSPQHVNPLFDVFRLNENAGALGRHGGGERFGQLQEWPGERRRVG